MIKDIVADYLSTLGQDSVDGLDGIKALMNKHLTTFPFSSVAVQLGRDVSLDIDDIYKKVVKDRKGGYCFEHNKLFYEVLKQLGFDVTPYLARVVNNQDITPPKTHRITMLNYEGERYLIDVGFGFMSANVPVKFGGDYTESHMSRLYRIEESGDGFFRYQFLKDNDHYTMYKFDLNPCYEGDFELGNFYSYKHPKAAFVNNLVLSMITDYEIRSLRNGGYQKIFKDRVEEVPFKSAEALNEILKDDFNCHFDLTEVEEIFNKCAK